MRIKELRGLSTEALRARLEALLGQGHVAPVEGETFGPADQIKDQIRSVEQQLTLLNSEQAELRGRLEQALQGLPDLADIDRGLGVAQERYRRLAAQRRALKIARAEVAAAAEEVHREFAPRLNEMVGGMISHLTSGRYTDVRVDHVDQQLCLSVLTPEEDRLRPVAALSRGTLDQFYFALRLAVAELLAGSGESIPLLLDDTFVQVDDRRTEAALGFLLAECRRGRQVLLFTCHRREVELARRVASPGEWHLIELK